MIHQRTTSTTAFCKLLNQLDPTSLSKETPPARPLERKKEERKYVLAAGHPFLFPAVDRNNGTGRQQRKKGVFHSQSEGVEMSGQNMGTRRNGVEMVSQSKLQGRLKRILSSNDVDSFYQLTVHSALHPTSVSSARFHLCLSTYVSTD